MRVNSIIRNPIKPRSAQHLDEFETKQMPRLALLWSGLRHNSHHVFVWSCMVWYDMVWHGMVWYGMVWHRMTLHCMALPHTKQPPSLRTWRFPGCCSSEWTDKNFGCICHKFVSLSTNERHRFSWTIFTKKQKYFFLGMTNQTSQQSIILMMYNWGRLKSFIVCIYLSLFTNKAVLYFFDKLSRMALSWINQTLILETKRPSAKTGLDKAKTANMLLKVSAWLPWWPKKPTKTRVAFVTGGGFALPHKQSECILHRGVFVCFATCVFAYFMRPPLVW